LTDTTARSDAYLRWRERLAAKQQANRTPDESPKAAPNPMWDPANLFPSATPGTSPPPGPIESPAAPEPGFAPPPTIDLRNPVVDLLAPLAEPRPARTADPAPKPEPESEPLSVSARHRALIDSYVRSRQRPEPPPKPSVADALRELNEQRVAGEISEDEFKARKAELFS
jgi:hypothetical protein